MELCGIFEAHFLVPYSDVGSLDGNHLNIKHRHSLQIQCPWKTSDGFSMASGKALLRPRPL